MQKIAVLIITFIFMFTPLIVNAQGTSADFSAGSVIIGGDATACGAGIEGAVRYSTSNGIEFCDGSNWTAAGGSCTVPSSCTNVGDTCSDGSLFAGFMVYGTSCEAIYITDVNQSTGRQWSSENINTGADDYIDGAVNQAWIVANETLSQYPAFETCENLTRHGYSDWYLPSKVEYDLIVTHKVAIGGFNSTDYWTSSEYNSSQGRDVDFLTWNSGSGSKSNSYDVRCIRRY